MIESVDRFLRRHFVSSAPAAEGQGLVEYSLILLFVVLVCVGALAGVGTALLPFYQKVVAAFP